jgi:hypothetical protein
MTDDFWNPANGLSAATLGYLPPVKGGSPYGQIVPIPPTAPPAVSANQWQNGSPATVINNNSAAPDATAIGPIVPFQGYPPAPPSQDALLVQQAALRALGLINPGQDESANVQSYTNDFAKVVDPNAINTRNWQQTWSPHSIKSPVESPVPGYPGYVVKAYNDPNLGNTVAVTYPTWSARHWLYAVPDDIFHYPMNPGIARDFMNDSGDSANGRK